jgi:hypothetical protein
MRVGNIKKRYKKKGEIFHGPIVTAVSKFKIINNGLRLII